MSTTNPVPTSVARRELFQTVSRFRDEGADAEPVVFGSHRTREAVVLPYEVYEVLMEVAEGYAIAARIRERHAADPGRRYTLDEVADGFDIDLETVSGQADPADRGGPKGSGAVGPRSDGSPSVHRRRLVTNWSQT